MIINELYAFKSSFKHLLDISSHINPKVLNNTILKINNSKANRKPNFIKDIFIDNWNDFKRIYDGRIRPSIIDNVEKMIKCKDIREGYLFYDCPNCGDYIITGLSCHSRFCLSCGNKYSEFRSLNISSKLLKVSHRHFTFSIGFELRKYFRMYRKMLDLIFHAVYETFNHYVYDKSKLALKEGRKPGIISFMHTFGRDLKWHPHIHALVAEVTIDSNSIKRKFAYFHYKEMRLTFMYSLLNLMNNYLKQNASKKVYNDFLISRTIVKKKYKEGFYIYAPQNNKITSFKLLADYITRYGSHPSISEDRILDYDEDNKTVTWYYDPHEDDDVLDENDKLGRQVITENVYDFMKKLVLHIPNKGFHLIRYFGFYANKSNIDLSKFDKMYYDNYIKKYKSNLTWRNHILFTYKYDPLLCKCGHYMSLDLNNSVLPKLKGT